MKMFVGGCLGGGWARRARPPLWVGDDKPGLPPDRRNVPAGTYRHHDSGHTILSWQITLRKQRGRAPRPHFLGNPARWAGAPRAWATAAMPDLGTTRLRRTFAG